MRHAEHDLAHAVLAAVFDHAFERGDHALAAIEAEALGADVFLAEELLVLFGLDHLGEDRFLALAGELDRLVLALHPILEEATFLDIGNVNVFEADMTAIIAAQRSEEHTSELQSLMRISYAVFC